MEQVIETVITMIATGGQGAMIAILIAIIVFLVWDRKRLTDIITKKDEKIESIIDNYYRGNLTLSEALSGLKLVLIEIKSKL